MRQALQVGGLLLTGALTLAVLCLFQPWGSSTANKTLASRPSELAYNIPLCVVLGGTVVLSWLNATRRVLVGFSLPVSLWWAVALSSDLLSTITHRATLGFGAQLAVDGAGLALFAAVLGWVTTSLRLRVGLDALIWAGVSVALAVVWVIGEWMPRSRTDFHMNRAGYTFTATGTKDFVTSCCVAFRNQTMPHNVREILTMTFLVVAAIVIAFFSPRRVAGIGLIAVGVLYLSDSLSWFYQIAQSNPNPIALGMAAKTVQIGHVTASVSAEPGGWLAAAAAFCLVVVGIFRLLSSFTSRAASSAFSA